MSEVTSLNYARPANWDEPTRIPELPATLERIMVPIDGSEQAEKSLAHAARQPTLEVAPARHVAATRIGDWHGI
jgi:hypothetical protein